MNTLQPAWWSRESFWRKCAIFVTAGMAVVLIALTLHTVASIQPGAGRVPAWTVINHRIDYVFDVTRNRGVPVIGDEAPLFGKVLNEQEAFSLIDHGKKTIQARNCINCHTLLGNGAYYAPDLTKAWLDPGWGHEDSREMLMTLFLKDPTLNARTWGTGRRMPNLGLSDAEVRGVIAYLKWMSAIDTNGFPANFKPLPQGGASGG